MDTIKQTVEVSLATPDKEVAIKATLNLDVAYTAAANPEVADRVIRADPVSDNGRSEWLWVRFTNGDLMLATYPRGDTYLETEHDPNRP